MTYCGKAPFHTYGKGNTNPAYGGVGYGSYMLSHNINAECGDQAPLYQGTYDSALRQGKEKTPFRISTIPRTVKVEDISEEAIEAQKKRLPIMPVQRRALMAVKPNKNAEQVPDYTLQKLEAKLRTVNDRIANAENEHETMWGVKLDEAHKKASKDLAEWQDKQNMFGNHRDN